LGKSLFDRIKSQNDERERYVLSKLATKSSNGMRRRSEKEDYRTTFFKDADRILHSQAYTRYIDKTQVFSLFESDLITHRGLHVQFVSKIARVIGRALRLNEDLIQAIALGHDIGHPPFGHEGEQYLSDLCKENGIYSFHHNVQGVRFLDVIEKRGDGWNLTLQVLDGILCHDGETHVEYLKPQRDKSWDTLSKEMEERIKREEVNLIPMTLEGCVVRFADVFGYVGRDIEDAITVKLIKRKDLPEDCVPTLGMTNSEIINTLVTDLIENSLESDRLSLSRDVSDALKKLKQFNYEKIYLNPEIKGQSKKIQRMFRFLFETFLLDMQTENKSSWIFKHLLKNMKSKYTENNNSAEIVRDFIAGMTDDYFNNAFKNNYLPGKFGYSINDRIGPF
jgi:dGTPase